MSGLDLRALREAAEGATPGEWSVEVYCSGMSVASDADAKPVVPIIADQNARFIAAANPSAVLALLDRLEAAEGAVERVRALADELQRLALPGMTSWSYAEDFRAALDGPR